MEDLGWRWTAAARSVPGGVSALGNQKARDGEDEGENHRTHADGEHLLHALLQPLLEDELTLEALPEEDAAEAAEDADKADEDEHVIHSLEEFKGYYTY